MRMIAGVLLSLSGAFMSSASAQSCPAADSVLGSADGARKLGKTYDKLTDTTQLLGVFKIETKVLSGGPNHQIKVYTAYEGQTVQSKPATFLSLFISTMNQEDLQAASGRGRALTKENARFADVNEALVLIDDSTRLKLPTEHTKAELLQANALFPQRLQETIVFRIADEQLRQLATARDRIDLKAGDSKVDLRSKEIRGIRDLLRFTICNPGPDPM